MLIFFAYTTCSTVKLCALPHTTKLCGCSCFAPHPKKSFFSNGGLAHQLSLTRNNPRNCFHVRDFIGMRAFATPKNKDCRKFFGLLFIQTHTTCVGLGRARSRRTRVAPPPFPLHKPAQKARVKINTCGALAFWAGSCRGGAPNAPKVRLHSEQGALTKHPKGLFCSQCGAGAPCSFFAPKPP